MKKRILSFILTAVMLVGMIVLPAAAASTPFKDVKDGKWYTEAIKYVYDNKLMNGMTDTTFEPDTPMNRAMLVTVLYRAEGEPAATGSTPFTDLKAGWYKKSVAWAYENKVVNGTTDTTFSPTTPITREQIATIFYRFAQFKGRDTSAKANLSTFPDGSKVAKYAKDAMTWAVGEGLITGTKAGKETLLDPKGNATRAQVATILMRYLESAAPSLEKVIEDRIYELECSAHGNIYFIGGTSSTVTPETLGAAIGQTFGCDAEITDGFEDFWDVYKSEGNGITVGGDLEVLFTRGEETYTTELQMCVRKQIHFTYTGAQEGCALGYCWDDVPMEIKAATTVMDSYENGSVAVTSEQMNAEYLETFFRQETGLADSVYSFYSSGIGEDGKVDVCFRYVDPVTSQVYGTGATVTLVGLE